MAAFVASLSPRLSSETNGLTLRTISLDYVGHVHQLCGWTGSIGEWTLKPPTDSALCVVRITDDRINPLFSALVSHMMTKSLDTLHLSMIIIRSEPEISKAIVRAHNVRALYISSVSDLAYILLRTYKKVIHSNTPFPLLAYLWIDDLSPRLISELNEILTERRNDGTMLEVLSIPHCGLAVDVNASLVGHLEIRIVPQFVNTFFSFRSKSNSVFRSNQGSKSDSLLISCSEASPDTDSLSVSDPDDNDSDGYYDYGDDSDAESIDWLA